MQFCHISRNLERVTSYTQTFVNKPERNADINQHLSWQRYRHKIQTNISWNMTLAPDKAMSRFVFFFFFFVVQPFSLPLSASCGKNGIRITLE